MEKGERSLQPTIFELALGRMLDVREYQIIQEDNTRFRIRVEPLPGRTFDRGRANELMRKQLSEYHLDKQLDVKMEAVAKLQAEENKKFRRIVPLSAHQPSNAGKRGSGVKQRAA